MNERQNYELVSILEDMISELGGFYQQGTVIDNSSKITAQLYKHLRGLSIDENERILSDEQLKLISDNPKARNIAEKIMNVAYQRGELLANFKNRVYTCDIVGVAINVESEMSSFYSEVYETINDFNEDHFSEMVNSADLTLDDFLGDINEHVDMLGKECFPILMQTYKGFRERVETDETRKRKCTDEIIAKRDALRSNSLDVYKTNLGELYKHYGSTMDGTDKGIVQPKEDCSLSEAMSYKAQFLLTKTKMMDAFNECAVQLEIPKAVYNNNRFMGKGPRYIDNPETVKENNSKVKNSARKIDGVLKEYKDEVKTIKKGIKIERKRAKKQRKNIKLLGAPAASEISLDEEKKSTNIRNEFVSELAKSAKESLSREQIIKKFITEEMGISKSFTLNPIIYNAIESEFQEYFKYQDISMEKLTNYKNQFSVREDGNNSLSLNYMDDALKLPRKMDVRIADGKIRIDKQKEDVEFGIPKEIGGERKKIRFNDKDTRIYDQNTSVEIVRRESRERLDEEGNSIATVYKHTYRRDSNNPEFVYKDEEKQPIDLSLSPEDMATLNGATDEMYEQRKSYRDQEINVVFQKKYYDETEKAILEGKGKDSVNVNELHSIVESEIRAKAVKEKINQSKYKAGLSQYSGVENIQHEEKE